MRRHSLPIGILAITCGLLANASPASAVSNATWVSPAGSDAGDCPITAPCRTFSYAHSQTTSGGAINVLSSGNFGPLVITKSISIVADGAEAVINTATSSAAITVNGSGIVVSLRGLTIEGVSGFKGISFIAGAALHVQNCVIRKSASGIKFAPAAGTSELYVSDSVIANSSVRGIEVEPTGSGSARILLNRVKVETSVSTIATGIAFRRTNTTGSIRATVRDSIVFGHPNLGRGIHVTGLNNVMVDRTAVMNHDIGILADGAGADIWIGDSTVNGNVFGLSTLSGGAITSFGTNKVSGNNTDGSPTSTVPTM